jgi:RimK family alpha-L-glutamate ligase
MNNTKIALFFGGKISQHLVLLRKAAKKLGTDLDLISYNRVTFDTVSGQIKLRDHIAQEKEIHKDAKDLSEYDVLFFRTTGKHWEEVNLVLDAVDRKKVVIVDPLVEKGRPSDACKAYQMLALNRAGIDVPKTVYGSLWYLYEYMLNNSGDLQQSSSQCSRLRNIHSDDCALDKPIASISTSLEFPVILKGSGGDRGTRVYKADNLEKLEKLVKDLRKSETEEGRRYMLQEYIENDGDYRVLVLGKRVLGVMKRSSTSAAEFKNNYSAGGKVEVANLSQEIKDLAVKAADVCGLWVAGVDVAFRNYDLTKPVIWEVNKGPQFKGFMKATGIDVPAEMVKFLVSLKK